MVAASWQQRRHQPGMWRSNRWPSSKPPELEGLEELEELEELEPEALETPRTVFQRWRNRAPQDWEHCADFGQLGSLECLQSDTQQAL